MEFPPPSDPPPSTFVPVPNYAPPVNYVPVANYTTTAYDSHHQPLVPSSFNHPSYEEMISSAIIALNEKDGSSRQAIAKYIENHFRIDPSQAHSYELTQQLKRMKNSGRLVLVKHSYMFPGTYDGMSQSGQGQVSDGPKRRPGRPPKLQPNGGLMGSSSAQPVVVGFENQVVGGTGFGVPTTNLFAGLNSGEFQFLGGNGSNDVTAPLSNLPNVPVSDAPALVHNYDPGAVANVVPIEHTDVLQVPPKRGRGRPRKVDGSAVKVDNSAVGFGSGAAGEDAAAQNNVGDGPPVVTPPTVLGKRRRGRPAKFGMTVTGPMVNGGVKEGQGGLAMVLAGGKRGRGRPRKYAVGAGGVLPVAKKPRKVSGKPLGRPRKNVSQAASLMSEIQLMAYEGLKARVEHYQSRIKTAVGVVKPYLNETAVIALGALQDLEELASMDIISVPPSVQSPPVDVQGAPVDVQSAPVNVNVFSAPVDLNAPVNVQGTAPENIQSAPLTGETVPSTFQSVPSTGETIQSTFHSAPVSIQGQ